MLITQQYEQLRIESEANKRCNNDLQHQVNEIKAQLDFSSENEGTSRKRSKTQNIALPTSVKSPNVDNISSAMEISPVATESKPEKPPPIFVYGVCNFLINF